MITKTAPAKLNLYLHVGPVRVDGLHELASLFVFTETGDRISVFPAPDLSLDIIGPFAAGLAGLAPAENLVFKAAAALRRHAGVKSGAAIQVEKNLPIASGIGGGSADAAAALRALIDLWGIVISESALERLAFDLGADVPACLRHAPVLVAGAGEKLSPGPALPPLWACLANSGAEISTGAIFQSFDAANPSPPAPRFAALDGQNYAVLIRSLNASRNDLEAAARELAPEIGTVIDFLRDCPGALWARMSGSGATCFALFASAVAAKRAANLARSKGWWAMSSRLCAG